MEARTKESKAPQTLSPEEANRAREQEEEAVRILRSHFREARLMKYNAVLHFEFGFRQGGLTNHKKVHLTLSY